MVWDPQRAKRYPHLIKCISPEYKPHIAGFNVDAGTIVGWTHHVATDTWSTGTWAILTGEAQIGGNERDLDLRFQTVDLHYRFYSRVPEEDLSISNVEIVFASTDIHQLLDDNRWNNRPEYWVSDKLKTTLKKV